MNSHWSGARDRESLYHTYVGAHCGCPIPEAAAGRPRPAAARPLAQTSSRMGAGLLKLFFASEDNVFPSSATSPTGLFPCTVLYK